MTSPKSVELKLGAKEPSMEEVKRCELKLPVEIKRTARIRCGGRVSTEEIASRHPIKEEKVPTPVRRSARIRSMKRKDYKEVSPEAKDYGGVTIPMIVTRARGRPPEEMIMICIIGKRCPRRRLPKAPTAVAMTTEATMATTTTETLAMTTLSRCIRCVVRLAVTPPRSSTHRSTSVSRTWR
jgi:hypothetical protein